MVYEDIRYHNIWVRGYQDNRILGYWDNRRKGYQDTGITEEKDIRILG
jgi:hypothetical protein